MSEYLDLEGTKVLVSKIKEKAPLTNPTFTGIPTVPTAVVNANNTQVANTAFVTTAVNNATNNFFVATLDSPNIYKIITGQNKTNLSNGYSIIIAIPSASNGATNLIVDSVTAIPIKNSNNNVVTNLKANGVYNLTYYNSVFILAGGNVDIVNFTASDLLTGKSANNSDGEKVDGTMVNRGAITTLLNCGGSYTIPAGYHNGSGKVTANSLSSQTSATATAAHMLSGKTAWVNGTLITGNIPNIQSKTFVPTTTYQTISANQFIASPLFVQGDSNLVAKNIISGKSIFGIAGTATVQSMGGRQYFNKVVDSSNGSYYSLPFVPSMVIINNKYIWKSDFGDWDGFGNVRFKYINKTPGDRGSYIVLHGNTIQLNFGSGTGQYVGDSADIIAIN